MDSASLSTDGAGAHTVIVGAGLAGVQTGVALREQKWPGAITVIGSEPHVPYDRPPLSKAVLTGRAESAEFDVDFDALGIELRLGVTVTALRVGDRVLLTDAGEIRYDRLVLATGAEPLTLPGSTEVSGVGLLRTLDDARRLRPVLESGEPVVVVGAGWIGAEFTTAAREAGCPVTVVEAADRPLAGTMPAEVAAPMTAWYAEAGADLRTGVAVRAVHEDPAAKVELADGTVLPASAVVVGIGARPATDWLRDSGVDLAPDGSVRVDEQLRTSVPGVYAVGDCASFPSARYGERLLIHHWDNALQGPRAVAAGIAGGDGGQAVPLGGAVYDPVPYFWSEQFGRFVQYVGHHRDGDELLWRGEPDGQSWSVCWLREGRLNALLAVGRPRDLAQGRKLVERGAGLDRELAADPSVPLKKAAVDPPGA
ncbi:FAD-dependent oxidoreductase [Streptomyces sp. XM4193]|uniref:NAD(P)/FAD-dependent oxidoreductase n=1 Tax=Streptomyces sp. XM4193 TaxID=2929782 RepID=UPI001FFC201F|nr:FAD-dependent oxidoreductase [Streptomyces sp. XM4193]MCK1796341.1 FAD-dependent oxidoreductase [Streptomyces sp. XM4193]